MHRTIPFTLLLCLLFTLSCGTRRRVPPPTPDERIEQSLHGQWNAIDMQTPDGRSYGIPGNLLGRNEQGIELRSDGVYMPRLYDIQSNAWSTNRFITGYWKVTEEKYLHFSNRPHAEAADYTWEILEQTSQSLFVKDHRGNTIELRREGR